MRWSLRAVVEAPTGEQAPSSEARLRFEDAVVAAGGSARWLDRSVEVRSAREAETVDDAFAGAAADLAQRLATQGLGDYRVTSLELTAGDVGETTARAELGGIAEFAAMLGLSPSRASSLTRQPDFPPPVARLAAGPVWRTSTLAAFAASYAPRTGRPPKRQPVSATG